MLGLDYKPHPKQAAFHRESKRFASLVAGVRGGKTYAGAREFILRVYEDRARKNGDLHYWCCAPTYAIGKIQQRDLFLALGGQGSPFVLKYKPSLKELYLNGGSRGDILVEFKTTERPETLVAAGIDGLWLDEVARMKEEAWLGGLRQRITDRAGWAIFSTTPLGRNWYYSQVIEKALNGDPDYSYHSWFTSDNTAVPGLAEEVEKARKDLPEIYFRREYEASFDAFIGQIYTNFKYHIHITDKRPDKAKIVETRYGVDWGVKNPGVILVLQKDSDGIWWLQEEVYQSGVLSTGDMPITWVKIAKKLRDKWGDGRFICDHDAEKVAHFRRAGLKTQLADKDVVSGIETVAKILEPDENGIPGIYINSSCKETIREFAGYRWKDSNSKEEPEKENDHAMDAMRYALHSKIIRVVYA